MENLTPARFSDMMGIQRSGISHLLSGRNKPSFEFIQKMMKTFPKLDAEWLILGKGKPYKENYTPVQSADNSLFKELNLFSSPSEKTEISIEETEKKKVTKELPISELPENRIIDIPNVTSIKKSISRIIVFYSDGTFEER